MAGDQRGEGVPGARGGVAGDVADLGRLGQGLALGVLVAEHPLQLEPAHHERRAAVGVVRRPLPGRRPLGGLLGRQPAANRGQHRERPGALDDLPSHALPRPVAGDPRQGDAALLGLHPQQQHIVGAIAGEPGCHPQHRQPRLGRRQLGHGVVELLGQRVDLSGPLLGGLAARRTSGLGGLLGHRFAPSAVR